MLYNCWPDISITYRRIICTTLCYLHDQREAPILKSYVTKWVIFLPFGYPLIHEQIVSNEKEVSNINFNKIASFLFLTIDIINISTIIEFFHYSIFRKCRIE
jgi:hypothetical protein